MKALLRILIAFGALFTAPVGNLQAQAPWAWAVGVNSASNAPTINDLATDAAGNVYVTGSFTESLTLGTITLAAPATRSADAFVAKLNPAGQWQWAVRTSAASATSGNVSPRGLAVDATGTTVCVVGDYETAAQFGSTTLFPLATGINLFVARLTASTGQWLGVVQPAGANTSSLTDVAVSGAGVFVVGSQGSGTLTYGTTTLAGQGSFVARLSTGSTQWDWAVPIRNAILTNNCLAANPSGTEILVTGRFGGQITVGSTTVATAGNADVFVARYAALDGQGISIIRGGGVDEEGYPHLAVDAQGRATVAALFTNSTTFGSTTLAADAALNGTNSSRNDNNLVVAQLNATGTAWQWATRLSADVLMGANSLTTDASGQIYVGGNFLTRMNFGSLGLRSSAGNLDGFVAQLSPTGQVVSANLIGGPGYDYVQNLAASAQGQLYVSGSFANSVAFGSTTLTVPAGASAAGFVGRYGLTLATRAPQAAAAVEVFPNPTTSGRIAMHRPEGSPAQAVLLDGMGREVRHYGSVQQDAELNVLGLTPGVYLLRLLPANQRPVVQQIAVQ